MAITPAEFQPPQHNSHDLTFTARFILAPHHGKTEQNMAVSIRTSLAGTIHFTPVITTQKIEKIFAFLLYS